MMFFSKVHYLLLPLFPSLSLFSLPPSLIHGVQEASRPGYNEVTTASEYRDLPHVFSEKIGVLCSLLRASSSLVAYTGAGLSTSSGIADYASRRDHLGGGEGEKEGEGEGEGGGGKKKMTHPYDALPTPAHHVLVALHREGILKHWIQQVRRCSRAKGEDEWRMGESL